MWRSSGLYTEAPRLTGLSTAYTVTLHDVMEQMHGLVQHGANAQNCPIMIDNNLEQASIHRCTLGVFCQGTSASTSANCRRQRTTRIDCARIEAASEKMFSTKIST